MKVNIHSRKRTEEKAGEGEIEGKNERKGEDEKERYQDT